MQCSESVATDGSFLSRAFIQTFLRERERKREIERERETERERGRERGRESGALQQYRKWPNVTVQCHSSGDWR